MPWGHVCGILPDADGRLRLAVRQVSDRRVRLRGWHPIPVCRRAGDEFAVTVECRRPDSVLPAESGRAGRQSSGRKPQTENHSDFSRKVFVSSFPSTHSSRTGCRRRGNISKPIISVGAQGIDRERPHEVASDGLRRCHVFRRARRRIFLPFPASASEMAVFFPSWDRSMLPGDARHEIVFGAVIISPSRILLKTVTANVRPDPVKSSIGLV